MWLGATAAFAAATLASVFAARWFAKRREALPPTVQDRFDVAIRGADDALWSWNIPDDMVHSSPRMAELLECDPRALPMSGEAWMQIVHPDDRAAVKTALQAHLDKRLPFKVAFRGRVGDGSYRWFMTRGQATWDPATKKPVHVSGWLIDVTDQKRAELAIQLLKDITAAANAADRIDQALETALRKVMEFTGWPHGGAMLPVDGGLFRVVHSHVMPGPLEERGRELNQASAGRRWGPADDSIPGRILATAQPQWACAGDGPLDPSLYPAAEPFLRAGLRTCAGFPVVTSGGCVEAVLMICTDLLVPPDRMLMDLMADVGVQLGRVAEREQAAQRLRESETRFRATFEQAEAGIAHVDFTGRFLRVNEQMCRILGYTSQELLSRSFHEVTYDADADASAREFARIIDGGADGYTIEKRYRRKDGSSVWANLSVSLARDESGAPAFLIGMIHDVSERRRLELELEDRLRFEELISDLSSALVNAPPAEVNREIQRALRRTCDALDVDRASFAERTEDGQHFRVFESFVRIGPPLEQGSLIDLKHPWSAVKLRAGESVWFSRLDELPPDASVEREAWASRNTKSCMVVPVLSDGEVRFTFSMASVRRERLWSEELARRVRTFGDTMANALIRARAHEELRLHEASLRRLNAELSRAEDGERRRLAAALHDELAQNLFAATARLVALRAKGAVGTATTDGSLDIVVELLDVSLAQVRDLTFELCPPVLYELGLVPAVNRLAEQFERRHGLRCVVVAASGGALPLDAEVASLLYQVIRELLNNVVKHAHAKTAEVRIDRDASGGLTVVVSDDGTGPSVSQPGSEPAEKTNRSSLASGGFGLFNVRERVRALGGRVDVGPGASGGFTVKLGLPESVLSVVKE